MAADSGNVSDDEAGFSRVDEKLSRVEALAERLVKRIPLAANAAGERQRLASYRQLAEVARMIGAPAIGRDEVLALIHAVAASPADDRNAYVQ